MVLSFFLSFFLVGWHGYCWSLLLVHATCTWLVGILKLDLCLLKCVLITWINAVPRFLFLRLGHIVNFMIPSAEKRHFHLFSTLLQIILQTCGFLFVPTLTASFAILGSVSHIWILYVSNILYNFSVSCLHLSGWPNVFMHLFFCSISSLVYYSLRTENIEAVMCNGQWIMKDRKMVNIEEVCLNFFWKTSHLK